MPYLTPDDLPEGRDCRALLIPASSDWLAIVSGALTELTKDWNWEQWGSVTVDEAIAAMTVMIDDYYEGCSACTIPGGYAVIRLDINGKIEILQDGEYVTPTEGDYYIPPPEAREGGTPEDQICLAAKNAVNVLDLLYENLSESWASELSLDAAIIGFVGAITTTGLFALVPITWAIVIPLIAFFGSVYKLLEYVTADIWDEDFTHKLTCIFVECATNDAGVVTFDWTCIQDKLSGLATEGGFNELQTRLNLQIAYILQFIGGVDALNLAARTTEITNDDCSFCDDVWCFTWDFEAAQGAWTLYPAANGTYDTGVGFVAGDVTRGVLRTLVDIQIDFVDTVITGIGFTYEWTAGTEQGGIQALDISVNDLAHSVANEDMPFTPPDPMQLTWIGEEEMNNIYILAQCSINAHGGSAVIKSVTINGKGECPFGEPNC